LKCTEVSENFVVFIIREEESTLTVVDDGGEGGEDRMFRKVGAHVPE
jgi:hypothetical protein